MTHKILTLGMLLVVSMIPLVASAASKHFTCSDTMTMSNVTCANGNEYTFTASPVGFFSDQASHYFVMSNSATYYLTFDVVSGGGTYNNGTAGDTTGNNTQHSGSQVELSLTAGTDSGGVNPFYIDAGSLGASFTGVIKNLCIDDDGVSCAPNPPATGGDTATSSVDKALDVTYDGVILYAIGFWGVLWFFRKRQ